MDGGGGGGGGGGGVNRQGSNMSCVHPDTTQALKILLKHLVRG